MVSVDPDPSGYLRIGEMSRRAGVAVETLRAWERRYGLIAPSRTSGGFRLYSDRDLRHVELMLAHLATGLSAAEAARLALQDARISAPVRVPPRGPAHPAEGTTLEQVSNALAGTLDRFDEQGAHAALDRALGAFGLDTVLRDLVLPYLHELGSRWERGEATVAQEHFASRLLHGRLLGLARDWGEGTGPRALLACAPGETHDLALVCFGLALRARGWRIVYLGTDTPAESVVEAARVLGPSLVVVNVVVAPLAAEARVEFASLAATTRLALAGRGADDALAAAVGAEVLRADPVTAAAELG